jgi:hypothetical protein
MPIQMSVRAMEDVVDVAELLLFGTLERKGSLISDDPHELFKVSALACDRRDSGTVPTHQGSLPRGMPSIYCCVGLSAQVVICVG